MHVARRVIVVVLLALVAASCSADDDTVDPPPVFTPAGEATESLADPGTTLLPPIPEDPPEIEGPSLAAFAIPCGVDASAVPADAVGIDDAAVRIATGNDEGSRFAIGSGESIPEAVTAMAEHCNTFGGLAGRVVAVDAFDAVVTEVVDVAARQCDESFAAVGFGYLQASFATETWNACRLPRFVGWPADLLYPDPAPVLAHRFAAFSSGSGLTAAIVVPDTTAGRAEAEAMQGALTAAGFAVTVVEFYPLTVEVDWAAMSERIGAGGAGVIHASGPCRGTVMALLAAGGADGPLVVTGPSSYDDACRRDAIADGVPVEKLLIQTPFLPVEDGADAPVTSAFAEILERFGASVTGDALLASAAFWEFAVAVDGCRVVDITRACVGEQQAEDWDGAGLYPTGEEAACRVVIGVGAIGFERVVPAEPGRYGCPEDS